MMRASLSLAPYFTALSTLVDGLWSVIMTCSLFIIIYCHFFGKKKVSLMPLEQLLLNVRTCGISQLASFLIKSVASFLALLLPINSSSPPPIFPYFIFASHKGERAVVLSPSSLSSYYRQPSKGSLLSTRLLIIVSFLLPVLIYIFAFRPTFLRFKASSR